MGSRRIWSLIKMFRFISTTVANITCLNWLWCLCTIWKKGETSRSLHPVHFRFEYVHLLVQELETLSVVSRIVLVMKSRLRLSVRYLKDSGWEIARARSRSPFLLPLPLPLPLLPLPLPLPPPLPLPLASSVKCRPCRREDARLVLRRGGVVCVANTLLILRWVFATLPELRRLPLLPSPPPVALTARRHCSSSSSSSAAAAAAGALRAASVVVLQLVDARRHRRRGFRECRLVGVEHL